jgi:photosystem II stability/assembly factor-like uncharacterized protein
MNRHLSLLVFMFMAVGGAHGQWEVQPSRTTANLRGIHSVNGSVAWASGADGTVLLTENGGLDWRRCATPPGAEKLDFRGIWAWDAQNATVMSSGPGDQSRLYKTTDGCSHWTEELKNADKDGFWDALAFQPQDFGMLGDQKTGVLIGDPVHGRFDTYVKLLGHGWFIDNDSCVSREGEAGFAASNTAVYVFGSRRYVLVTGGKSGPRALLSPLLAYVDSTKDCLAVPLPLAGGNESSGAFSVAFRDVDHGVVVGGDYKKPDSREGTAAWTSDGGRHWTSASQPPHGYRSAVAWDSQAKLWIAVGTNGSDISRDDGKTWRRLDDGNWNALSLPYVVGPNGRIGKRRPDALKP